MKSFDSVGSFTMLHHVPTLALQNRVLAEAFRVLQPGGVLVGSDSLPSNDLHHFHVDDTYNPLEPAALLTRLQTIGYGRGCGPRCWRLRQRPRPRRSRGPPYRSHPGRRPSRRTD